MTRPISAALKAHYALGTTTLASCVKATLTNGTIVAMTTLDRDITYDSVLYKSVAGYRASAVVNTADLSVDNLEISGFLTSPAITEADVLSGLWDYAAIEFFEVNYNDLTMGRNLIRKGTLGEVRAGRTEFVAELRSILQKLSRRIVQLTSPTCLHDLGDSKCLVNLATSTVTGNIDVVASQRQFTDTARTEANDWFTGGLFTFTSGLNNGLKMEVRRSTSGGVITLQEAMPFTIQAGDTYSLYAGCTKRLIEDCKTKFNNVVRFGGFPHVPLSDVYKRGS